MMNYILFPNHDNAMRLYRELRKETIYAKIAPTPRSASKCCGVSLIVKKENLRQIQETIKGKEISIEKIVEIEEDINPQRDKYC